jgi:monoterpene epsilon-lactone hydrolase
VTAAILSRLGRLRSRRGPTWRAAAPPSETNAAVDCECTRAGLVEMAAWYLNGADVSTPLASPVFGDARGLCDLLAIAGGDEILLDDSVRLVNAAKAAGRDPTLHVVDGMQHVFPIWKGALPEADEAIELIGQWICARTM